jgi:hypothetical protein
MRSSPPFDTAPKPQQSGAAAQTLCVRCALCSIRALAQFANMVSDLRINSADSVQARLNLRTHPEVLAALERWRSTAWHSMEAEREHARAHGRATGAPLPNELGRTQYVHIMRKVVKALCADWSDEEATRTAEEDWEADRRGRATLSVELFMDAVFELADLCAPYHTVGPTTSPLMRPCSQLRSCACAHVTAPM